MSATPAGAHLLIVDDNRLILATIAAGLRQAGYRVTEASDGSAALELAKRLKPDLALLDVRMPGMSGVEVAESLASNTQVPFIFLSAYGDADTIQRAKELGAIGYLVKPLDVPQIIPEIEAALARGEQIGALKDKGEQLSHALESGRETSVAIGILMERYVDRDKAFEALRSSARAHRRRVHEIASELVAAVETIN